MFKRFDPADGGVSSISQIKSSQGRAIRTKLVELYPAIEPLLDELLPKKDPMNVAKCQNHVTIVLSGKEPLFFQVSASLSAPTEQHLAGASDGLLSICA
jgi:PUA domain protein